MMPGKFRYVWAFLLGGMGLGLVLGIGRFSQADEEVVVTLPIEVIGPDGFTVDVTVYVSDTTGVDSLYLKAHNLGYHYTPALEDTGGYDKKASFRINGGAWIPIDNDHFKAFWPEAQMHTPPLTGPIGGPYRVLRGMISIRKTGKLRPGKNTITFRFNRTEGRSSGYRILELDLRKGGRYGESVLKGTRFVWDDPASWRAPQGYDDPAAILEGERLWASRKILKDAWGSSIIAACADCHAHDGRDLKYFNFSNQSIIARARFHGLSLDEAKKIAAYIRSIDLKLPPGETVATCGGRPWNPPYQPGPGLSKRPVECWAAGAGWEWVLEDERELLAFLVPDAASQAKLSTLKGVPNSAELGPLHADLSVERLLERFDLRKSLPITDIPTSFPMPDLFEWWPSIYPGDYFGDGVFHSSGIYKAYEKARDELPFRRDALIEEARKGDTNGPFIKGLPVAFGFFAPTKALPSDLTAPASWNDGSGLGELARLSFRQWTLIKLWELLTTYKLEDVGLEIYGQAASVNGIDLSGWRYSWPVRGMWVYDMATHKQGSPYPDIGPYPTLADDQYFSMAWYQLSQILNNGLRAVGGTTNVDWNYVFAHIDNITARYKRPHGVEYLKSLVVMMQTRTSWYLDRNAPDWMALGFGTQNRPGFRELKEHMPLNWFYLGHASRERFFSRQEMKNITEALLLLWIQEAERHDPEHAGNFLRNLPENAKQKLLLPADTTYDLRHLRCDRQVPLDPNWWKDEAMLQFLYQAQCYGVDPTVLDRVARYMERLSPGGNWERFFVEQSHEDTTRQAELVQQTISLHAGWNLVSLRVHPIEPALDVLLASIRDRLILVKDKYGRVYSPELGVNQIGNWDWQQAYMILVSAATSLTVSGTPVEVSTPIALEAGWNLIPYWPAQALPVQEALGSLGSALVLVKDVEGRLYFPEYGVQDLSMLEPGQGYKVYVQQAITLQYPHQRSAKHEQPTRSALNNGVGLLSSVLVVKGVPEGSVLEVRTLSGKKVGEATAQKEWAVVVIWGDEPLTTMKEGAQSGEALELWWHGVEGMHRLQVQAVVDLLRGEAAQAALTFAPDQVWQVSVTGLPTAFKLENPYPNPVATTATFTYVLPEAVWVRLEVYDVLGRRVATLVDEQQAAGTHRVVFNAQQLAGGAYFYQLQAGSHQSAGKMVVMR
jgi:hypothetical protein